MGKPVGQKGGTRQERSSLKRRSAKPTGAAPKNKNVRDAASAPKQPSQPSLRSLTVADLSRLLVQAGGKHITEDAIAADLAQGAPVAARGRIDLFVFAAWLVREGKE